MTEYYWITKDGFKTTKQTEKTMTDHKLEAIEMYTKILEVVKGQDFHDTTTALRFAQTKIETDFYAKQQSQYPSGLLGGYGAINACAGPDIARKAQACAEQVTDSPEPTTAQG